MIGNPRIRPVFEFLAPCADREREPVDDRTEEKDGSGSFGDILKQKIQSVKDLEMQSLQSAYDISTGASSDIESAMIDATKASTAIETTVQLTTRAVNAYKEIMSMQV